MAPQFRPVNHTSPTEQGTTCTVCGRLLDVHEAAAGVTCRDRRCGHEQLKRALQERARVAAAIRQRLEGVRDHASGVFRIGDAQSLTLADLPSNDRALRPLPEKRRREFRDNLTRSISRAAASLYGTSVRAHEAEWDDGPASPTIEPTNGELQLLGGGCAICRGHCCEQGATHAFLNPVEIRRYMLDRPGQRPRHVLEAFLSRLPHRTPLGSCVFHAESGCALPRSMRSSICNAYYCDGLNRMRTGLVEGSSSSALVAAVVGETLVRAAVVESGRRREVPLLNGRSAARRAGADGRVDR